MEEKSEQLLEAKDASGRTPYLVACCQKEYMTMELLSKAGADLYATDNEKNTAVILAATHLEKDDIPPKDISPEISKVLRLD